MRDETKNIQRESGVKPGEGELDTDVSAHAMKLSREDHEFGAKKDEQESESEVEGHGPKVKGGRLEQGIW